MYDEAKLGPWVLGQESEEEIRESRIRVWVTSLHIIAERLERQSTHCVDTAAEHLERMIAEMQPYR